MTNYLKYSKNDFDIEHIDYLTILSYVYAYVEDEAADAVEIVGTGEWIPKKKSCGWHCRGNIWL